jgi:hypothetical protein
MRSKVQRLESSSACHATNLGDEGLGEKRALHLTELDALPADLYLGITPTYKDEAARRGPMDKVARLVPKLILTENQRGPVQALAGIAHHHGPTQQQLPFSLGICDDVSLIIFDADCRRRK